MAAKVGPLNWQIPIVNPNGTPTDEFQRAWVAMQGLTGSIPALDTAQEVSNVLDKIGATPGSLLHRGASGWQIITGADGDLLKRGAAGWQVLPSPNDNSKFLDGTLSWTAPPVPADIQTMLDSISNVQGVILYRDGSAWVALPPGTAGQFLQTAGAGANPTWAAAGGGGSGARYSTTIGTAVPAVNTGAFATKGGSVTLIDPITISDIYTQVDANVNGAQFRACIAIGAPISSILGTSNTITWLTGDPTLMTFNFSTPVVLPTGVRVYLLVSWINAPSGVSPLRIYAANSVSLGKWPGVPMMPTTSANDGINVASINPTVGDTIAINGVNHVQGLKFT